MIKSLILKDFKNVHEFATELDSINVLVGSNNSGKSSVIQGIHFTILAEVARRASRRETVTQQEILYAPASDFTRLRHKESYTNTNITGRTSSLELVSDQCSDGVNLDSFLITISKGRNEGNLSVKTINNNPFRQLVTQYSELYSIYVPGLSGIPFEEKQLTYSVIRKAAANGDANLYLRNIIYYLCKQGNLSDLNGWIERVFPNTELRLPYDPDKDTTIIVTVYDGQGEIPLELCGMGFLQIVQIIAYALLFKPKLLLLDEPDEHLHADNQSLLSETLLMLSNERSIQMIICTHSRHLISSLDNEARFIWMKAGVVFQSNATSSMYEVLLDIGAIDTFDNVLSGQYTCVFLTEDKKVSMLKKILQYNNFDMSRTMIYPYKGSSKVDYACQLADFIHQHAANCLVVIHRDKDFMTEDEVDMVKAKINRPKCTPFITAGSDIEAYFLNPQHLAELYNISIEDIHNITEEIARQCHVEIQAKFQNKRLEIYYNLYNTENRDECPGFLELFGRDIPTQASNRMGKFMLEKVKSAFRTRFGSGINIQTRTDHLIIPELQNILHDIN
jgi:AAA15 family ATPase/GTPase